MIKVTFRALVLLFMNGMLRCFDYIENLSTCRSWMGNTSGKYLGNLIKNPRCKTTCCFIRSGKQQFLHIFLGREKPWPVQALDGTYTQTMDSSLSLDTVD